MLALRTVTMSLTSDVVLVIGPITLHQQWETAVTYAVDFDANAIVTSPTLGWLKTPSQILKQYCLVH